MLDEPRAPTAAAATHTVPETRGRHALIPAATPPSTVLPHDTVIAPDAAAWAQIRPAPGCRYDSELEQLAAGVEWNRQSADPRLRSLGSGALAALLWVGGVTDRAPLTEEVMPLPSMREVSAVAAMAGRGAAGIEGPPGGQPSDAWRIYCRGVQECLFWCAIPTYPFPVWGIARLDDHVVISRVLGEVGADRAQATRQVSAAPFPYDPADRPRAVDRGARR